MSIGKEIKVGIVMLAALGVLAFGVNFLKGGDYWAEKFIVSAIYPNIDGLTEDNPVVVNGLKIGKVEKIGFLPNESGFLLVTFTISDSTILIRDSSIARIVSLDLLGSKAISIELSTKGQPLVHNGALIGANQNSLQTEVNQQLLPLKNKAEELISSMDKAVNIVSSVLNEDMQKSLDKSFASINRGIKTFEQTTLRLDTMVSEEKVRIHSIFVNLNSITSNFKKNDKAITAAIQNLADITDTIKKADLINTIQNANEAMVRATAILTKIENGEGSLGMLIQDQVLYDNLNGAALDLNKLVEDMRINPERYIHFSIFGRRERPKDKDASKFPK